ncbi:MAG: hypothetical protein IBX64_05410, partial [Actinobacteria bacterium]|nr:hypothetical protein [Actinomycetota bacterium]
MFFYLWIFAHILIAATIGLAVLPRLKRMLKDTGVVKANFRQREVVNMMGVVIILTWVFLMGIAAVFSSAIDVFGLP